MEIAVDGFSACGKSTLAKALAGRIGATYIDTGAMYRAVTLYFLENAVDIGFAQQVEEALGNISISFDTSNSSNDCYLNAKNIEIEIRTQRVSDVVSDVAALSSVRHKLVQLQRELSLEKDVVMDGRDIGTVVFPNAKYKFFITADSDVRAIRRLQEYRERGIEIKKEVVLHNLQKRDYIDSTREDSPLKVAEDALLIDNTLLTRQEQLDLVLGIIT